MNLLTNTCYLQTWTATGTDSDGQPSGSFVQSSTATACRFYSYGSGRETLQWTEAVIGDVLFDFAADVTITERNRIYFGTATYEVVFVRDVYDGMGAIHHKVALARLIR